MADKKKKVGKLSARQAKKKLAGEVYDLLMRKYPQKPAGLPSRASFIKQNINGIGTVKPTSKADLERYKKELQAELGISSAQKADKKPAAPKKPAVVQKSAKPSRTATPADKPTGKKRTNSTTSTPQSKTKKPMSVQKPAKTSKPAKPAEAPKKPKLKPIKHSDAEENKIGGESPIHILKAKPKEKPKQALSRVLKRVAKSGGFTVFDGPRSGKTFATPEEAAGYAAYMLLTTGEVLEVAPTTRQITHTFKAESESKK